MNHITVMETVFNLILIGGLLFSGFMGGNLFIEYIEEKIKDAIKRDKQNKRDDAK